MENLNEHIDILIARCLSGEASNTEKAELANWRQASPKNEAYYDDVAFIYHASAMAPADIKVDANAAWEKLSARMDSGTILPLRSEKSIRNTKGYNLSGLLKIAAVVAILVVGLSALVRQLYPGKPGSAELAIVSGNTAISQNLPDGSHVSIKANSSLKARNNSKNGAREYDLKGEASFKVLHDDKRPFIIHTDKVQIKDIGTEFNVMAYESTDTVQVIMLSGTVQFYSEGQSGIMLSNQERGVYIKSTGVFRKLEAQEKKNILRFDNATLEQVVQKLNSVYGDKIKLANEGLKKCPITVKFEDEDLDTVIEVITSTLSIKAKKENGIITLYGKVCD